MNSKFRKPEFNVIAGTLEGLNNYMYNYTQSTDDNDGCIKNIFSYLKQALLNNSSDISRYSIPKTALILFANHAEQFDVLIYLDYQDLFDRIKQWTQHKNYEIKKLAYASLDSYYKQLASMLKKMSNVEPEKCKMIFKYFVKKFYSNLVQDNDLKETVIAIKGYGAFAGVRIFFLIFLKLFSNQNFQKAL